MKNPLIIGLVTLGIVSIGLATHTAGDIFNTSADEVAENGGTLKQGGVAAIWTKP